jgi:hypothetical protein
MHQVLRLQPEITILRSAIRTDVIHQDERKLNVQQRLSDTEYLARRNL